MSDALTDQVHWGQLITVVTCPRCGLSFESQATTATRCRSCRYVVRVGSSPSARTRRAQATSAEYRGGTVDGAVLAIGAVGLFLAFYVVPRVVRAVRRHRAGRAPTSGPVAPGACEAPPAPTAGDDGTRTYTGPSQPDPGPLA